jgi:hypothetical protein
MKKIISKTILLLIIITAILNSCTKPKEVLTISDEMKDYIMFPSGSYWIYEDTVTGDVDSVRLVEQFIDTQECFSCGQIYYENLNQTFNTSLQHKSYKLITHVEYSVKYGYIIIYDVLFTTNLEINTCTYNGCYIDKKDSLNNFNQVMVFTYNSYDTIYYAKNIGKIKYSYTNNDSISHKFILTNFNINK